MLAGINKAEVSPTVGLSPQETIQDSWIEDVWAPNPFVVSLLQKKTSIRLINLTFCFSKFSEWFVAWSAPQKDNCLPSWTLVFEGRVCCSKTLLFCILSNTTRAFTDDFRIISSPLGTFGTYYFGSPFLPFLPCILTWNLHTQTITFTLLTLFSS